MHESMEFSNEEDFVLTQTSMKPFKQSQSAGFGMDVVDNDSDEDMVTLECSGIPKFGISSEDLMEACSSQTEPCGDGQKTQIEDISSDDEVDAM